MAPAPDAVVLGPREDQLEIALGAEHAWNRRKEARPAGAAVILHRRREERQAAAGADEDAWALLAVERARACALGPFLAQDVVLRGVEPLTPLLARQPQGLGRQRDVSVRGEQRLPVALQGLHALHVRRRLGGRPALPSREQRNGRQTLQQIAPGHIGLLG